MRKATRSDITELKWTMSRDNETNPWKCISRSTSYDNPWIRVEHHEVINPNGGAGIYGKVHFKNMAIGIIPVDHQDHTWLVGQYRYPLDSFSWEIPEGGGPLGIDPLISAQRELEEECGLVAEHWEFLMEMHLSNSVSDEHALIYCASGLKETKAFPEETEQLQIKRLPVDEAIEMALNGEITDSISVAALQRLYIKRKGF